MRRRPAKLPGPGSFRLLGWLARLGVAGLEPMAIALGLSRSVTYSHVARLERAGLVLRLPCDAGSGVVALTAAGAREVDERDLGFAVVPSAREASTARHGRAVSWVAASADVRGWRWLGPGELREEPGWRALRDDGTRHAPDLGIVRDGKRTAVEVELHRKAPARLRSILAAYGELVSDGGIHAVAYIVSGDQVDRSVRRQASAVRLTKALSVSPIGAIVEGTQERGRATNGRSVS